ncbi:MAG: hypothetical protein WDN25_10070 [Acetobacteraceae bacterium]
MKLRAFALVALGLAACSAGAPPNSPQAQCEEQAENDPAVVAIYQRSNGTYSYVGYQARDELLMAKKQAIVRCMRSKGLAPPGGVQPVQPR